MHVPLLWTLGQLSDSIHPWPSDSSPWWAGITKGEHVATSVHGKCLWLRGDHVAHGDFRDAHGWMKSEPCQSTSWGVRKLSWKCCEQTGQLGKPCHKPSPQHTDPSFSPRGLWGSWIAMPGISCAAIAFGEIALVL